MKMFVIENEKFFFTFSPAKCQSMKITARVGSSTLVTVHYFADDDIYTNNLIVLLKSGKIYYLKVSIMDCEQELMSDE